jgi:hypothetical protein
MKKRTLAQAISVALLSGGLAACGGSSDTASNGSITTVGTVTGFGSVYVNGVKYETDSSSYRVDDDDAFDDSALAIGMKVKVKGTVNADGVTGTATSIEYDDDLEGPVAALNEDVALGTKTFEVFGIPVKATDGETIFDDGMTYADLVDGKIIEVSGYYDGTQLVATYIEPQDDLDDEFEVKGTVSGLVAGDTFDLTAYGTTIAVDISGAVTPAGLADGVFVEVKGTWDGSTFTALEVEIDDEDYLDDEDDDVELKGLLTHDGTGYVVNGVPLLVLEDVEVEDTDLALADLIGMQVEVEGFMQDGVLVVQEIGYEDGDIEIEGGFGAVTGTLKEGTVTIDFGNAGTVTVTSTNGTMIHGDGVAMNLADLNGTTCQKLEADAYRNDQDVLIATVIECDDTLDEYSVEAPVEAWDGSSITLAELTYTVDGVITTITPPGATITVGTEVELTDLTGDGVADTIQVDD